MTEEVKVAFCWYDAEEWEKLKQIAADKDMLDDTFKQWKRNANEAMHELREQGQQIQKVSIKLDQLTIWCEENGVENNSEARSRYAVEILKQRHSTLRA